MGPLLDETRALLASWFHKKEILMWFNLVHENPVSCEAIDALKALETFHFT